MGGGASSKSPSNNNDNNDNNQNPTVIHRPERFIPVDFLYVDRENRILLERRVRCKSTDTILKVAEDFLTLEEPISITSKEIFLAGILIGGRCIEVLKSQMNMTLDDLDVMERSLLCYEPLNSKKRREALQLFLFSPHDNKRELYEWRVQSTTLKMLLDWVIETFNLTKIKSQDIGLFTFENENLNQQNNSGKYLNDLGLQNYSSIFVTIKKFSDFHTYEQDITIHIDSVLYGPIQFHGSIVNSTIELEDQIKRRFPPISKLYVTLFNKDGEVLNNMGIQRRLQHLGVKSGETIMASVGDSDPTQQNQAMSHSVGTPKPLSTTSKEVPVYVQCEFSTPDPNHFEVSVTDTIAEVKSKILTAKKFPSTTQLRLHSNIVEIHNMKSAWSLAELDIKPGDTIYASIVDKTSDTKPVDNKQVKLSSRPLTSSKKDRKPCGLVNLGNTCFMNSALQCLIHVESLTEFFLRGFMRAFESNEPKSKDEDFNPFDKYGEMTSAYSELVWNMRGSDSGESDSSTAFNPTRIKLAVSFFAPSFATQDQQDAHEFIVFLLDALHNELKQKHRSNDNNIIKNLFFGTLQSNITCCECNHVNITINQNSFLPLSIHEPERTFRINFISRSGYHDKLVLRVNARGRVENLVRKFIDQYLVSQPLNKIIVIDKNSDNIDFRTWLTKLSDDELTLIEEENHRLHSPTDRRIVDSNKNLLIDECLRTFASVEHLEDLWYCRENTCRRKTIATKQLQFKILPRVVIIQLKRFSYVNGYRQKLDTFVEYPIDGLDLSVVLTPKSTNQEEAIYDLIAVSNHIGTIHSGHYTAYARQRPGIDEWYEFDDTYVAPIHSQTKIISPNAYLLFYIKRNK